MLQADGIANGIRLYTGDVSFLLNLAVLPGCNGLDLNINLAYNSNVLTDATRWNLTNPTGVAGLGWFFPVERIVCTPQQSTDPSNARFYLLSGSESSLLVRTGTASDGAQLYQGENFSFWRIAYYPDRRRWQVIHENGDTYIYGDQNTYPDSLQWGVCWDNWRDASNQVSAQQPYPLVFDLSEINNRFGDRITYAYENVVQLVGPASQNASTIRPFFTQFSYLTTITSANGEKVVFTYDDKRNDDTIQEYVDPHANPPAPDAYQSRFSTKYLDSLTIYTANSKLLSSTQLLYTTDDGNVAFLGTANLAKRLLTSVRYVSETGTWLPDVKYTYYGQASTDGVTASSPYNATQKALYGALKTVIAPQGGSTTYHYAQIPLDRAQRSCSVPTPVQTGVSFSHPRCYFTRDYTVITWFASDNSLRACAYYWNSRWLDGSWSRANQLPEQDLLPVTDASSYNNVPVVCTDDFFAAFSQNQMHLNAVKKARAGEWTQPSVTQNGVTQNYFSTAFDQQEAVSLYAGKTFAGVLGLQSGKLYRFRWDGLAWQADPLLQLQAGSSPATFAATAHQNYLFSLATASSQPGDPLHITLYYLDETGQWQTQTFLQQRNLSIITDVTLFAGDTFVVTRLQNKGQTRVDVSYRISWWNRNFSSLTVQDLATFSLSPTESIPTPVIQGSFVSLGQLFYRFDGTRWNATNVSRLNPTATGSLQAIVYGRDQAVRTTKNADNTYIHDLVQYNPNTALWNIPGNLSQSGDATHCNRVSERPNEPGNFVLVNNTLFYHLPDDTWQDTGASIPTLSNDDALSPQLLDDHFFLYQQAGNTIVHLLKNGSVSGSAIQLNGQQIYTPGVNLCGQSAFVTYSGTFGSAMSNLTLYRVVEGAVSGAINGYCVIDQQQNNQYQNSTITYTYASASAIASRSSGGALYNKMSVTPQSTDEQKNGWIEYYFFNGLTPAETPELAYPVDDTTTNAPASYSLVQGCPYSVRVFPFGASPTGYTSEDVNYWWVFRKALGNKSQGYYLRVKRDDAQLDSVVTSYLHTYSDETGLVLNHVTNNVNASGVAEQLIESRRYFWEVYDPERSLNLFTPVIQTTWQTITQGSTTITGIEATTYQDDWGYGTGQWATYKTYRALNDNPGAFQNWQPDQGDPTSGWLRTLTVNARTAQGLVQQSLSVDGIVNQSIFDTSATRLTAAFFHASVSSDEASYYGFDPYESTQGWGWTSPDHPLSEYLTTLDYHTGSQCLMLPANPQPIQGPVRTFLPAGQQRTYVFSCWVKTQSTFNPEQGTAQWTIEVVTADTANLLIATLTLPITDTANKWTYLQQVIDLPSLRQHAQPDPIPSTTPLSLQISASNQNSARYVLVDNLRFSPVDSLFYATVYDPDRWLVTATLDNNSQVSRTIYDVYQRVVATVNPLEHIATVIVQAFARDISGNDTFLPQFPNNRLQLGTTSNSLYYDFHDANILTEWVLNGAGGNWNVQGGKMVFTGTSTDKLGSTAAATMFAFTNLAIRVVCTNHTGNVGVGNGDAFALWDQTSNSWKLVRKQLNADPLLVHESTVTGFHDELVFLLIDGLLLFYAGGIQIFAFQYQNPDTTLPDIGKPALLLTKTGSFDDMLILNNPQLSVAFQDGFGNELQSVRLSGLVPGTTPSYQAIGQGTFLDIVGRPQYVRNAALPSLQIDQPPASQTNRYLLLGDQTTYLVNSQGQSIDYDDYIAGVGGFDYTSVTYEQSAISRVTSLVLPHEQNQLASRFTVTRSYGPATEALTSGILPPGVAGNYFLRTVTDQNGVQSFTVLDKVGRVIARRTQIADGVYHTQSYLYDKSGNLITLKSPNYYSPPQDSQQESWQEQRTHTFNNLLQTRQTPDSGLISYLYDTADRLRFSQDANSEGIILYYKYDSAGRMIEEGSITDSSITWSSVAAQVNNLAFPDIGTITGKWLKRYSYDVDKSVENLPVARYLLGRLWKAEINNTTDQSQPDTEFFTYTASGDIATHTSSVPTYDQNAYVTGYVYDNQRNIIQVNYPQKVGSTVPPFKVGYYYDRLGQLSAIGEPVADNVVIDPSQPAMGPETLYAAYTYNANASLAQERLNNWTDGTTQFGFTRRYSYDGASWLTEIDDPFFTEQITYYEAPGYNEANYYNGNISQIAFTFKPDKNPSVPADYSYQFAYDKLDRLTAAVNSLNNAYTSFVGSQDQGLAAYDANGNILHIQKGATEQTYVYHSSNVTTQTDNRVYSVSSSVNSTIDFNTTTTSPTCAQGWCWGSNNGGPSSSSVILKDGGPDRCLQLSGGSLGHYEYLQLQTYLAPDGTYALEYAIKTPPTFAASSGDAGWYLVLESTEGPIVEVNLVQISSTNDSWQTGSVPSIDVAALRASSGLGADSVVAILQLRNYKRLTSGSGSGSFLQVTDIQLTTIQAVSTGDFVYGAAGEIITAPSRSISQIHYDPVIHLAQSIQLTGNPGQQVTFTYDSSNQRLLKQEGPPNSQPATLTLSLYDQSGNQMSKTTKSGETESLIYHIYGPGGMLAFKTATGTFFPLKDHLTSTRLVIDNQNTIIGGQDYAPFGSTLRAQGMPGTEHLYTGQELDSQTKLYNYCARFYDPDLGRFYSPDPANQYTSPYIYVGNNPLILVDPDGEQAVWIRQDMTQEELDSTWWWSLLHQALPLSWGEFQVLYKHFGSDALSVAWRISEINNDVYSKINAHPTLFWRAKNTYRHPYWMCRLAREYGENFALELGYAHEAWHIELAIEGPYDSTTDKINNLAGVKLGSLQGDCYDLTRDAISRDELASFEEIGGSNTATTPPRYTVKFQTALDHLWNTHKAVPTFNKYDLAILQSHNIKVQSPLPAPMPIPAPAPSSPPPPPVVPPPPIQPPIPMQPLQARFLEVPLVQNPLIPAPGGTGLIQPKDQKRRGPQRP